ncbi:MAG: hypothetical protein KDE24_11645, partial [Caldilinea sp.]|nr:hypothetical protein [Caldilinea sp.]
VRLAIQGGVRLVMSDVVQEEARRNLKAKAPKARPFLGQLPDTVLVELVETTEQDVLDAQAYTETKDAPVVAAAVQAQAEYLFNLDRVHLVEVPGVAEGSGMAIVLPGILLQILRSQAT